MFVIPIGHEETGVRRWPWISTGIIGLCVLVHLLIGPTVVRQEDGMRSALQRVMQYYFGHPYLTLDESLSGMVFVTDKDKLLQEMLPDLSSGQGNPAPDAETRVAQQAELDALTQEFEKASAEHPYMKWGFVPDRKTVRGLIGCMFIHDGWLHLIGNLLFFYFLGPFIEDVWGRLLFGVFYLAAGMFAAMAFAVTFPSLHIPTIGASGAVAGVMGAFLIRFWKTRIKFFYFNMVIGRGGFFEAPAWGMFPLWFLSQVFNAAMVAKSQTESGGGVAYVAHIWGFIFGVAVALVVKRLRYEEKFIHPRIEAQLHYTNPGLKSRDEAMARLGRGDTGGAYQLLLDAVKQAPCLPEAVEALWDLSLQVGREKEAVGHVIRLLEHEIRKQQTALALIHYRIVRTVAGADISLSLRMPLIEMLIAAHEPEAAKDLYSETVKNHLQRMPAGLLLSFCEAAFTVDSQLKTNLALEIAPLCLSQAEIPEARKNELRERADDLRRIGGGVVMSPQAGGRRKFQVTLAIPRGIRENKLLIDIDNVGQRILPVERIKGLAVVRIASPGSQPYYLIDLFLDDPGADAPELRSVRLLSNRLDLGALFPDAANAAEALQKMILTILKISAAKTYPSFLSPQLKQIVEFHAIGEYEKSLTDPCPLELER